METNEMQKLVKPREEDRKARRAIPIGFNAKDVVALNNKYNKEEKHILRTDRVPIQITSDDMRHLKKGKYYNLSVAYADTLLKAKVAKKVTLKKDELIRNGQIVKMKDDKKE